MGNSGETHLRRTSKCHSLGPVFWTLAIWSHHLGSAGQHHRVTCRGSRASCGTPPPPNPAPRPSPVSDAPGKEPGGGGGFGSPSNHRDSWDSLWQKRDSRVLRVPNRKTRPASGVGVCRSQEQVREEHHWMSKECDPRERRQKRRRRARFL